MKINGFWLMLMHKKAIILLDNLIQGRREKFITQYLLRNCGCDFVINNVPNCHIVAILSSIKNYPYKPTYNYDFIIFY